MESVRSTIREVRGVYGKCGGVHIREVGGVYGECGVVRIREGGGV